MKSIWILVLFALIIKPIGSSDFAYFFSVGKIANERKNIYLETWQISNYGDPKQYKEDGLRSGLTYGPITVPVFRFLYTLSGGNLIVFTFLMRIINLLGILLCAFALFRIKKTLYHKQDFNHDLFLLSFSPIILFESVVNGHFDIWWVFFVLTAFYSALKGSWQYVLPLITIGIWIKAVPMITLPIFLIWFVSIINKRNRLEMFKKSVVGLLLAAAVTLIAWNGLWSGFDTVSPLISQAKWVSMSIYHVVYNTVDIFLNQTLHYALFKQILLLFNILFLIFAVYLAMPVLVKLYNAVFKKKPIDEVYYLKTIFLALLIYLTLLQKGTWTWYYIWPLVFGLVLLEHEKSKYFNNLMTYISSVPLVFYLLVFLSVYILRINSYPAFYLYILLMASINIVPIYFIYKWRKENYE